MDGKKQLAHRLSASRRRHSATIAPSAGYPSGRFPMPDKQHAKLALQFLPRAKNLSGQQAAEISARAKRILGS